MGRNWAAAMGHSRQSFKVPITCSNCQELGQIEWEESASMDRKRGAERRLLAIRGNFHCEEARGPSGDPLIVCNKCDQIQPD
jgi:hypothetical protein